MCSKGKLWKPSHIVLNSPITHTTPTRNIPEVPELGTAHYKGQNVCPEIMVSAIEGVHSTIDHKALLSMTALNKVFFFLDGLCSFTHWINFFMQTVVSTPSIPPSPLLGGWGGSGIILKGCGLRDHSNLLVHPFAPWQQAFLFNSTHVKLIFQHMYASTLL